MSFNLLIMKNEVVSECAPYSNVPHSLLIEVQFHEILVTKT